MNDCSEASYETHLMNQVSEGIRTVTDIQEVADISHRYCNDSQKSGKTV